MDAGVDHVFAFVFSAATNACVFSDHAGAQSGESSEGFDRGAGWKSAFEGEVRVDCGSDATGLWIENDDRAFACTEYRCGNRLIMRVIRWTIVVHVSVQLGFGSCYSFGRACEREVGEDEEGWYHK